jgi:antitoxin component YwqK of YwqJK toxin-antitoxin module
MVVVLFRIGVFAQQDSGFTNKAEAKNLMVNGLKEGKWIIYSDSSASTISDTLFRKYCFYTLCTLVSGIIDGRARSYDRNGKIVAENYYNKGRQTGIQKTYFQNGKIMT